MYNRRGLAFVLVLILAVSIMGCGTKSGNQDAQDTEDKTVVAKVNGEKVTKGEFNSAYNQIKQSYYITEDVEDDPEQAEMINELKLNVLDQLIMEKLTTQKAKDAGFILTDDILDEAKKELDNIIFDVAKQMEEMDKAMEEEQGEDTDNEDTDNGDTENKDEDDKDYIKEAEAYLEEELDAMGQTQDEYIEFIADQMILNEYMESMVADVNADEEEIKAYYEEMLKSQKENEASTAYGVDIELYQPEETRVKHVLIKLSEEDTDKYNSLLAEEKEEEAKEYLDEKLKAIEPKAKEVLEKAKNGESFEALVEEYGEDPGMEDNEVGYIVRENGDFMPEFEEAAFKLKEDEISDLVATSFGYHIIKLYERYPDKEYTLEEKHDEIEELVSQQNKAEAWNTMLDEWMEDAKIKRYEKRL